MAFVGAITALIFMVSADTAPSGVKQISNSPKKPLNRFMDVLQTRCYSDLADPMVTSRGQVTMAHDRVRPS